MSFSVPSLAQLRAIARDALAGKLKIGALLPNSRARFIADANAGLVHLCIKYITWISEQIFPDKAGDDWLRNRHAKIWLGGDKAATFATGFVQATGVVGSVILAGTQLSLNSSSETVTYETRELVTLYSGTTPVPVIALSAGLAGNVDPGTDITFTSPPAGVDATATVVNISGGVDAEKTEELRLRVLQRIRNPPMGGDAADYVKWMLDIPGVTRAWCAPMEMGVGTVTIRFMMDNVRSASNGIPLDGDIALVKEAIDNVRPVTVKDFFVVAPIPYPISFTIYNLLPDNPSLRASIEKSIAAMLYDKGAPASANNGVIVPAQKIYQAWISKAILDTDGVDSFELDPGNFAMPNNGSIAVPGSITYGTR